MLLVRIELCAYPKVSCFEMAYFSYTKRYQQKHYSKPMRYLILAFLTLYSLLATSQTSTFNNYSNLKGQLNGVKVVLLGEVNHSDVTSMIEKVEFIKYLHDSLDFTVLAFESSIYDMHKGNELLDNNVEDALYTGIFPVWYNTESMDSLISVLKSKKFTLAGFDNQICSGSRGICLELVKELEQYLIENEIRHDKNLLKSLATEIKSFNSGKYSISPGFTPQILEEILSLGALIKSTNHAESAFWHQNLLSIHGLLFDHYYNNISDKTSETFKPSDSNKRDSLMALNVMYLLNEFPESKIICWGATYHFTNGVQTLNLSGSDLAKAKPMGYYLKKELGNKISIIGFTDLAKAESKDDLLENVDLFRNEKAVYNFSESSIGKSSFINYAPYPEGDWSEALDLGIVINSKGSVKLNGQIVSTDESSNQFHPVPYALVQIEGTTQGSVANENGMFELVILPEYINHKIIFSSLGYETMPLTLQEIKSRIHLFEKADLLDEVVVTPKEYDPTQIIRKLVSNRVKGAPMNPMQLVMYSYQEENNSKSNELRVREAAIEQYYENRLQDDELGISNILNYRNSTKNTPSNPWPYAIYHADLQSGSSFTIDQTFKKLQIDSIYSYDKDRSLNVIEYTHLKPNLKNSGFGLTSEWSGAIIYDPKTMTMKSHSRELHFKENEDYGLFHINFNIEYFMHEEYIFPRVMTSNYQFKKEDGSISNGKEKILITVIELDNVEKPTERIWQFENASFDKAFWKRFNTIPLLEKTNAANK